MKIKFKPFFRITKVKRPHFRAIWAYGVSGTSFDLFLDESKPIILNPEIYTIMDYIDQLRMAFCPIS